MEIKFDIRIFIKTNLRFFALSAVMATSQSVNYVFYFTEDVRTTRDLVVAIVEIATLLISAVCYFRTLDIHEILEELRNRPIRRSREPLAQQTDQRQ